MDESRDEENFQDISPVAHDNPVDHDEEALNDGYSPINSPDHEMVDHGEEEEWQQHDNGGSSRKRGLEEISDDELATELETADKRPKIDEGENLEKPSQPESITMESDHETRESEPKETTMEQESEFGIFGEDEYDSDEGHNAGDDGTDKIVSAFTDMVDEIDEDDDDEGVELDEEQGEARVESERRNSTDSEVDNDGKKGGLDQVSDFDVMMQRRKEAMSRARKRRRKDEIDLTPNDDNIQALLQQMKYSAEEDCRMNIKKQPAVKKLTLLPTIINHLKKVDLLNTFIENGICSALADWLKPLPDHSLPHLKIREDILDVLLTFPEVGSHVLKTSGLGKAIMLLYRHPKETRRNRLKAGKLINDWSRPIFGLNSDYKSITCSEREKRDWARLSQSAKRRLSNSTPDGEGSSSQPIQEEEGQKPGEKGWIPRARVPMPSYKDYVVRPKWNVEGGEVKKGPSKKVMNRYEKQIQKNREKQSKSKNTHAISISIEGRKMPL